MPTPILRSLKKYMQNRVKINVQDRFVYVVGSCTVKLKIFVGETFKLPFVFTVNLGVGRPAPVN